MRVVVDLTSYEADVLMRPDRGVEHDPLDQDVDRATDALVDRVWESALDKVRSAILRARVAA
jgi:hypothetical protein